MPGSDFTINVNMLELDIVAKIVGVIKEIMDDNEISEEVRKKYARKFDEAIKKEG